MESTLTEDRQARMDANRQELAERIRRAQPFDGHAERAPGLWFNRMSAPDHSVHGMLEPSCCVVAGGSKEICVGGETFRYDATRYLIATMGVPAVARIVRATPQQPYLSVRFLLEPATVTSVMVESGIGCQPEDRAREARSVDVGAMDEQLLDATLRLVRLVDAPRDYRVLAPLVVRELIYRLLTGAQTARLLHLARFGGQDHRMVRAVKALSDDFDKPLRVVEVASRLGMSVSGFHAHFKAATNMSPLQFQKLVRLQQAQRLMLNESLDAGQAAYRVGYGDQSHFSRDYKRLFGQPPVRDIEQLRQTMGGVGAHVD